MDYTNYLHCDGNGFETEVTSCPSPHRIRTRVFHAVVVPSSSLVNKSLHLLSSYQFAITESGI